jgi:anti-sigma factor RsiW
MSDTPSAAKKDHRLEDVLSYKQGFLEGAALAEFEAHLRDCAACQATLESVSRFLPALQQALMPPQRSTEELWAAAQAQFARQQEEKRKPRRNLLALRLWMPAFALSAAAAIFFIARPLLVGAGPELVVNPSPDAGADYVAAPRGPVAGIVGSPRPPNYDADAGPDAGVGSGGGVTP